MMFAVFGTLLSTVTFQCHHGLRITNLLQLVIGYFLYGLALLGIIGLDSTNPLEWSETYFYRQISSTISLTFASLLSAVDPVATLSILGAPDINADPLLYSLVFGETVLNDAVSIVLFKSVTAFVDGDLNAAAQDLPAGDARDFSKRLFHRLHPRQFRRYLLRLHSRRHRVNFLFFFLIILSYFNFLYYFIIIFLFFFIFFIIFYLLI
jgi:hypothetical protein